MSTSGPLIKLFEKNKLWNTKTVGVSTYSTLSCPVGFFGGTLGAMMFRLAATSSSFNSQPVQVRRLGLVTTRSGMFVTTSSWTLLHLQRHEFTCS
jgi:hypothetical protein